MIRRLAAAAALLLAPALAKAQALQCAIPARVPPIHPELPSADQPARVLPIGGYTLAISWSPEYCHDHGRDPQAAQQCGRGSRFGFTLHGLWPDGIGPQWPQYCRAAPLLPAAVIRPQLCATPSAQLVQHEWAKHGTCMAGETPASYFARSTGLYHRLRYPDMDALSRQPALSVGMLAAAFARANPGIDASMLRVTANARGWLDEVWLCLDKRLAHTRCRANSGGLSADSVLQIWRGSRQP